MLHFRLALLPAFALLLITFMANDSAARDNLKDQLEPVRQEFALPALVAAVAHEGKIVAAGASGVRAIGHDAKAELQDQIHIGSDTKAMTALLAGMAVEEGRLAWDSTIGEVLGDEVQGMNETLAKVRLEQLLSHSSGIPSDTQEMIEIYFNTDAFDYNLTNLRLMALEAWKKNEPVIPENSPFQYANFGYLIAGTMLETAMGQPWEALIQQRIFQPLELETAGLGATATPGLIDALVGHFPDDDGQPEPRLWGAAADIPPIMGPAGTAHMSILDFARWGGWIAGQAERGPDLVEPETLAYIMEPKVQAKIPDPPPGIPEEGGYALGWGFEQFDWAERPLHTHNGSNSMNLAKILIDRDQDLAIVVATNIGGEQANLAAGEIMKTLYLTYGKD
ncbi:serine hydrolase domain-containing protein [Fodinicurvata sediminis]|uniref:serine hydrolase domain-containing protein n=1 Tax=Fodinicurvata sediminis TaxID=1121832 RepID=UPI0003B4C4B5|nr:serine hydrolase [Fodinicurvata sediminis]